MKNASPDDFFSNDYFEVERYENNVIMRNVMNSNQQIEFNELQINRYEDLKSKIDDLVVKIRDQVVLCDPIKLLSFASEISQFSLLNKFSEIEYTFEEITNLLATEYLQSVIVSSDCKCDIYSETDSNDLYVGVLNDVSLLYQYVHRFLLSWAIHVSEEYSKENQEVVKSLVESQMNYKVRGKRYQIFQDEYYSNLLSAHDEVLLDLFGIDSAILLEGLNKLEVALSQERVDQMKEMCRLFDEYQESNPYDDIWEESHREKFFSISNKQFGFALNDVCEVTKWPVRFVEELSFGINEYNSFYSVEYSGWPIIDLPVQKKPFLKYKDKFYCFDYYLVFDYVYRDIQKSVTRLNSSYKWSDKQQYASEHMTEQIITQLLPGCQVFSNNYYPFKGSFKNMAENDILVSFRDVLLIVEVKAGSFTYTAPITDFESHINSYKNLIEKPNIQCQRTYDYIQSSDVSIFYDDNQQHKHEINKSDYSDIYMLTVTIDNINEFAARAEKICFLQINKQIISISIDDLMVYRTYFESPLRFLHFLKHRRNATQEKQLVLNDELDHLGLYIEHNSYPLYAREFPSDVHLDFWGYREKLDNYFCKLYHPSNKVEKPEQELPDLFIQILDILDKKRKDLSVESAIYLLDFSSEEKSRFQSEVYQVINQQNMVGHPFIIHATGTGNSLRYSVFVNTPEVCAADYFDPRAITISTMLKNKEENRALIDITFDSSNQIIDFMFMKFIPSDCAPDEHEYFLSLGNILAEERFIRNTRNSKVKVGRNERCPCGSGKKYKHCCGN